MLHYNKNLKEHNMSQVPFDTLEYSKILIDAGMDRPLAEAQAEAQVKIIASLMQNTLATKDDTKEIKDEITDVRNEITDVRNEITDVRNEITDVRNEITDVRNEIKDVRNEITDVKNELKDVRSEIKTLETKLILKMGSIVVVALTALTLIMKICHF
jgi:septal ring factor EnvC (AmiA/AmiB activator)